MSLDDRRGLMTTTADVLEDRLIDWGVEIMLRGRS
jgi:hypothetical protein